jgi:3-(3-hydroxy-phenyl)propionate hydroxylase
VRVRLALPACICHAALAVELERQLEALDAQRTPREAALAQEPRKPLGVGQRLQELGLGGFAAGEDLLDTHGAERGPHARALVRLAALVGRLMTGGGAGAVPVRRAVLAAVTGVPALAAYATDSRTPPLRRGPLVDRSGRAGRRLAGTLVPRARVRAGGDGCRIDDVLGAGTAVVALAGPGRVAVTAGGRRTEVDDVDGALTWWLTDGRARFAVVRPDRVVRAAG